MVAPHARALFLAGAVLATAACRPDFGERESLVTRTQVLAMRAEPAEARPGEEVSYTLLVASPGGAVEPPAAEWSYCATPKLLAENEIVSPGCLATDVRRIGTFLGPATAPVPADACSLFGPETPPGDLRPRDPDVTGGFFQPVRASLGGGVTAFGLERVTCDLANASADVVKDFKDHYAPNKNPTLAPVAATVNGAATPLDRLPAGRHVKLSTSWTPADAERYLVLDPASQAIATRRESMRVSWFVTAGELDADRTGRAPDETETFTENGWRAPDAGGEVFLWVVLRDSRGGTSYTTTKLMVLE